MEGTMSILMMVAVVSCFGVLAINVVIYAMMLKLYTEFFKERVKDKPR